MKKGLLVVIEGIDGSGKTTQVEFLKEYLASQGLTLQIVSFPRYEDNIYGKLVRRYLKGEFGDLTEVNPYLMALVYAGDRSLAKFQIEKWLDEGKLVLANRYVSSSKAHLGANLPEDKREKFIRWIDELEYKTNGIPKEDLTIFLDVDPKIGQNNVSDGLPDLHEDNLKHLTETSKIYLELAKKESDWYIAGCMEKGEMKKKAETHQEIVKILNKKLI